jgi:hypothetical protein
MRRLIILFVSVFLLTSCETKGSSIVVDKYFVEEHEEINRSMLRIGITYIPIENKRIIKDEYKVRIEGKFMGLGIDSCFDFEKEAFEEVKIGDCYWIVMGEGGKLKLIKM